MKRLSAYLLSIFFLLSSVCQAQETGMADVMRSNGKIYVVMVIACIVLLIVGIFIINTDRKITRLERKLNSKN